MARPSPHRISLRLRLDFFDSPSRVILWLGLAFSPPLKDE